MSKLYDAAIEVQSFCDQQEWRACIIGGLAVIRWGEHRTTEDVDFSLLCDLGDEDSHIQPLLQNTPVEFVRNNERWMMHLGIHVSLLRSRFQTRAKSTDGIFHDDAVADAVFAGGRANCHDIGL